MRLYCNSRYPNRWYAHSKKTGWVMFPAEPNGWSKREAARGVDPLYTREVAIGQAAGTGIAEYAPANADELLVAA